MAAVATRTRVYEVGTYVDERTGERVPNRIARWAETPQRLADMKTMAVSWRTGEFADHASFHFEGVEQVLVFEVAS